VDLSRLALKPFAPPADVRERLRAVARETAGGFPSWYGTEAKLKVLELLLTLKALAERGGVTPGHGGRPGLSEGVERVRRHLESSVDRRVRLRELAALAGMNPFTLCRKFREETGATPLAYHRRLRLQEAARLLREDRVLAKEVARRLAFPSPQYFHRAFKRFAGVSPGAVRRSGEPVVKEGSSRVKKR
jgi:AraC-like DNA-binding protein